MTELGVGVTVTTPGGTRATVGVVTGERATACGDRAPSDGSIFEVVSVGYAVEAGSLAYGPTDWIVRAGSGQLFGAVPGVACRPGPLGAGTLKAGSDAGGWVTFEVPVAATHLVIFYAPAGGARAGWRLQ